MCCSKGRSKSGKRIWSARECLGDLSERPGNVGHEDSVSGDHWEIQIQNLSETSLLAYHRTLNAGRPRAQDVHYIYRIVPIWLLRPPASRIRVLQRGLFSSCLRSFSSV